VSAHRIPRAALVAYGGCWLAVAGLVAVVIRLQVADPSELLGDVADRRAVWIGANALLIAMQALLTVGAPFLARDVGRRSEAAADAVRGLGALAAASLAMSGVFHGVLGAHLADQVTAGPLDPDLVRSATVVHALGDTCWFVGLGALSALTAVTSAAWWRSPSRPRRRTARLGAVAVVCGLLQFGWFVDHAFGLFATPGTLLQALWLGAASAATTDRPPVTAVEAPTR
jgi:hypothetical protein